MSFDQIADFILGPLDIPPPATDATATLLVDTLGVAAGAAEMEAGQIARNHAHTYLAAGDPSARARIMFDGRTASVPGAAFALASQIDNLDAHDGYNPVKGHIGCAVVPAVFAIAEQLPDLPARVALDALTMSYEIGARAGKALHGTVSDYHTSGAWNALAVAALGARLFGFDKSQLRHALGIAEYHGPRSQMMREIANPTMLHDGSGMGVMTGLMAVFLARDGFTGAPAITVENKEVSKHWVDLGQAWTVAENYIKPYPICRWAHAAIDALARLMRDHAVTAANVAHIQVNTFREAAALYSDIPQTTSQAQYSMHFALGAMLVHGKITAAEISGAALSDPRVQQIVTKIATSVVERHQSRFPAGRWSDVVVTLTNGEKIASGDQAARGGTEDPLSLDEVEAKFHNLSAVLPSDRRERIWSIRERMQRPDIALSELAEALYPPVATS